MSQSCPTEDALIDYARGLVSQRARRALDLHLDACSSCRAAVAVLARRLSAGEVPDVDTAPEVEEPALPGRVLGGRFRLEDVLGVGAMGTVYRAHDVVLDGPVAVKVLRRQVSDRRDVLAMLRRELNLSRRVSHPNVCPVYDLGLDAELKYITMRLVEGETLDQRLERGPLGVDEAARVLHGIASALAAAHAQSVVHRDLKAANVMVEPDGHVWVTDFGLARDLESKPSHAGPVGTPAYWSPEQAVGETATPASDVYSFGVLAYRLFTGQLPRRHHERPDLGLVPARFRALVATSLHDRVSDRFPDGAALLAAWPRARRVNAVGLALAVSALLAAGVVGAVLGRQLAARATVGASAPGVALGQPQTGPAAAGASPGVALGQPQTWPAAAGASASGAAAPSAPSAPVLAALALPAPKAGAGAPVAPALELPTVEVLDAGAPAPRLRARRAPKPVEFPVFD